MTYPPGVALSQKLYKATYIYRSPTQLVNHFVKLQSLSLECNIYRIVINKLISIVLVIFIAQY